MTNVGDQGLLPARASQARRKRRGRHLSGDRRPSDGVHRGGHVGGVRRHLQDRFHARQQPGQLHRADQQFLLASALCYRGARGPRRRRGGGRFGLDAGGIHGIRSPPALRRPADGEAVCNVGLDCHRHQGGGGGGGVSPIRRRPRHQRRPRRAPSSDRLPPTTCASPGRRRTASRSSFVWTRRARSSFLDRLRGG